MRRLDSARPRPSNALVRPDLPEVESVTVGRSSRQIGEVILARAAARTVLRAAKSGYEAPYKEERLGILLGRKKGRRVEITGAITYKGGTRKRTSAEVDADRFVCRVRVLEKKHRLRFMGTFHTHNQIGDSISSAPSQEDAIPLCENPAPLVELVVLIWTSKAPLRQSQKYLQIRLDDYRIRIASYACNGRLRLLPTYSSVEKLSL